LRASNCCSRDCDDDDDDDDDDDAAADRDGDDGIDVGGDDGSDRRLARSSRLLRRCTSRRKRCRYAIGAWDHILVCATSPRGNEGEGKEDIKGCGGRRGSSGFGTAAVTTAAAPLLPLSPASLSPSSSPSSSSSLPSTSLSLSLVLNS
jgi:hypothetical protein